MDSLDEDIDIEQEDEYSQASASLKTPAGPAIVLPQEDEIQRRQQKYQSERSQLEQMQRAKSSGVAGFIEDPALREQFRREVERVEGPSFSDTIVASIHDYAANWKLAFKEMGTTKASHDYPYASIYAEQLYEDQLGQTQEQPEIGQKASSLLESLPQDLRMELSWIRTDKDAEYAEALIQNRELQNLHEELFPGYQFVAMITNMFTPQEIIPTLAGLKAGNLAVKGLEKAFAMAGTEFGAKFIGRRLLDSWTERIIPKGIEWGAFGGSATLAEHLTKGIAEGELDIKQIGNDTAVAAAVSSVMGAATPVVWKMFKEGLKAPVKLPAKVIKAAHEEMTETAATVKEALLHDVPVPDNAPMYNLVATEITDPSTGAITRTVLPDTYRGQVEFEKVKRFHDFLSPTLQMLESPSENERLAARLGLQHSYREHVDPNDAIPIETGIQINHMKYFPAYQKKIAEHYNAIKADPLWAQKLMLRMETGETSNLKHVEDVATEIKKAFANTRDHNLRNGVRYDLDWCQDFRDGDKLVKEWERDARLFAPEIEEKLIKEADLLEGSRAEEARRAGLYEKAMVRMGRTQEAIESLEESLEESNAGITRLRESIAADEREIKLADKYLDKLQKLQGKLEGVRAKKVLEDVGRWVEDQRAKMSRIPTKRQEEKYAAASTKKMARAAAEIDVGITERSDLLRQTEITKSRLRDRIMASEAEIERRQTRHEQIKERGVSRAEKHKAAEASADKYEKGLHEATSERERHEATYKSRQQSHVLKILADQIRYTLRRLNPDVSEKRISAVSKVMAKALSEGDGLGLEVMANADLVAAVKKHRINVPMYYRGKLNGTSPERYLEIVNALKVRNESPMIAREAANVMHQVEECLAAGHRERMPSVKNTREYWPIVYNCEKIVKNRDAAINAFVKGVIDRNPEMSLEEANKIGRTVIDGICSRHLGLGEEIFGIDAAQPSLWFARTASSAKKRVVDIDPKFIREFLETDVTKVVQNHVRKAGFDAEFARVMKEGGRYERTFAQFAENHEKELDGLLEEGKITVQDRNHSIMRVRSIMSELAGYRMNNEKRNPFWEKYAAAANAMNYMSKCGMIALTSVGDLALTAHLGPTAFMQRIGTLLRAVFKGPLQTQYSKEYLESVMVGVQRLENNSRYITSDISSVGSKLGKLVSKFNKATGILGFDDANQIAMYGIATKDLLEALVTGKTTDRRGILGFLQKEMKEKIKESFERYGSREGWYTGAEHWDPEVSGAMHTAIMRAIQQEVVRVRPGQMPIAWKKYGPFLAMFQSYVAAVHTDVISPIIKEGRYKDLAKIIGTGYAISLLVSALKRKIAGGEIDWDSPKFYLNALHQCPLGLYGEAINPIAGLINIASGQAKIVSGQEMLANIMGGGAIQYSIEVMDAIGSAAKAINKMGDYDADPPTQSQLRKMHAILPFQNWYPCAAVLGHFDRAYGRDISGGGNR